MNKNQYTDKKLQTEILEYINSFPCEYPRSEPTQTTIDNYFVKDKKIDKNKLNHNINELYENGYIKHDAISTSGYIYSLTEKGKNKIKPIKNFFISHWQWVVATILAIAGLYIAYLQLLKSK